MRALAFGIYCQINIRNKYIIYNLINKLWRVWNYDWLVCCNDGEATNHNAQSKKTWRHSFSVGDPVPPKLLLEEKFEDKVWEDGMVMGLFSNELVVCRDALLSVVVQTPLLSSRDFDNVSLNVEPHSVQYNKNQKLTNIFYSPLTWDYVTILWLLWHFLFFFLWCKL